jgi:hypothetical protein
MNARLAKILQCDDYDFTNQEPRLWSPSSQSLELTMEQQFKLKQIENALRNPETKLGRCNHYLHGSTTPVLYCSVILNI